MAYHEIGKILLPRTKTHVVAIKDQFYRRLIVSPSSLNYNLWINSRVESSALCYHMYIANSRYNVSVENHPILINFNGHVMYNVVIHLKYSRQRCECKRERAYPNENPIDQRLKGNYRSTPKLCKIQFIIKF